MFKIVLISYTLLNHWLLGEEQICKQQAVVGFTEITF